MFCPACGTGVAVIDEYCRHCGASLTGKHPAPEPDLEPQPEQVGDPAADGLRPGTLGLVGSVASAVGAVLLGVSTVLPNAIFGPFQDNGISRGVGAFPFDVPRWGWLAVSSWIVPALVLVAACLARRGSHLPLVLGGAIAALGSEAFAEATGSLLRAASLQRQFMNRFHPAIGAYIRTLAAGVVLGGGVSIVVGAVLRDRRHSLGID